MTQEELTLENLGSSLDDLANLDPRGYGVCKILYRGARAYQGEALTMNAAKKLCTALRQDDVVYLISGFVLRPYNKAETDGIISTMLLARCLIQGFGVRPVIICPDECMPAVEGLASILGFHMTDLADLFSIPLTMSAVAFPKDATAAENFSDTLIDTTGMPRAVISIEAPGANAQGVYHNAIGKSVTDLEAKTDILWEKLYKAGVLNIAIGDLGNEIGMGAIAEHIQKYIPYAGVGACSCGCDNGILAKTKTDNVITATVSDWGCYGFMAAIAYLKKNLELFHDGAMQERAMRKAAECGVIDMYGWSIPAIDGIGIEMTCAIVEAMRGCVEYTLRLRETCSTWFEKTIEKGFFA
ncbi:MAG: DUF4392 domain-containing protein [Clostridiales bacterium]|jgi:hypothetical protein|nr:DUF4392 domain-containing protein [Clostridiales bacterium]